MLAMVGASAAAPPAEKKEAIDATAFQAFNQAELVFTGKVARVIRGAVTYTEPPGFHETLIFDKVEVLRGAQPGKAEFAYSVVQPTQPEFPAETTWVVAAFQTDRTWVIRSIRPADDRQLAAARLAVSLPIGWNVDKNEVLSPWAALGKKAWPGDAPQGKGPVCARTGRPSLMAGEGIEIRSEQVLPEKRHEFRNPFGDGQFKITVVNRNDRPVTVPALLTDGKTILWEDSLVVVWAGKSFVLPGAGKLKAAQSVRLKPGESVSTVVDVLPLQGVQWARGGWRLYFQFCLGEKATTNFFYYHSGHHDPLREAAVRKSKE
jgi:hypothetical protein